jgi:hypothetical protein
VLRDEKFINSGKSSLLIVSNHDREMILFDLRANAALIGASAQSMFNERFPKAINSPDFLGRHCG